VPYILRKNGKLKDVDGSHPLVQLAEACLRDDLASVTKVLASNNTLDCNTTVVLGKSCIGTPLVLCGTAEIAELLIAHGADVALACDTATEKEVAPLASAEHSLRTYRNGSRNRQLGSMPQLEELVLLLQDKLRQKNAN